MSPEQTGRINHSLDYRADFYTLGVTLYEMLMGFLPFQAEDAVALVHAHIAQMPSAPHQLNHQIPLILSNIIMKLLAKPPEARYQSAAGLVADLQYCWQHLQHQPGIPPLILGQHDVSSTLRFPQKLYGRTEALKLLEDAYARLQPKTSFTNSSTPEIIFVSGSAGLGEIRLIANLSSPVNAPRSPRLFYYWKSPKIVLSGLYPIKP